MRFDEFANMSAVTSFLSLLLLLLAICLSNFAALVRLLFLWRLRLLSVIRPSTFRFPPVLITFWGLIIRCLWAARPLSLVCIGSFPGGGCKICRLLRRCC